MTAKRRYHRVTCNSFGVLQHDDTNYKCRLENVSPSGALVSLKGSESATLRRGDTLVLRLHHETEKCDVVIRSRVAHIGFSMLGLAFLDPDAAAMSCIEKIITRASRGPA